jgi:hypothetical protein
MSYQQHRVLLPARPTSRAISRDKGDKRTVQPSSYDEHQAVPPSGSKPVPEYRPEHG